MNFCSLNELINKRNFEMRKISFEVISFDERKI